MAVVTINTGNEHYLAGMAIKQVAYKKNEIDIFPEEDNRGLELCCYDNLVLADNSGGLSAEEILYRNDVNSFMFNFNEGDTVVFKLVKNGSDIATLNDNTYGTYYALGSITEYSGQELMSGYELEWKEVLNLHGRGVYNFKIEVTSFGSSDTVTSINYYLEQYSQDRASQTIRIQSVMNGYMRRSRINYKGIQLIDMVRVRGIFKPDIPDYVITNDLYASLGENERVVQQRKVNQVDNYSFETFPLLKCIANKIINYHFFGNEVYVSDYNVFNYSYTLKNIRVHKAEEFEYEYFDNIRSVSISGSLKEDIQDNEKTNC